MRPKIVLIENVALLRSRGLDQVLCDLDSIGYAAEWDVISAAAVGAPHLRERIWIIARPKQLASRPVYGEPARDKKGEVKTFSMVGKLPRAGRMDDDGMIELVPLAPRKTKRKDGWSYWTGVNLLSESESRFLWPSSSSRDFKDVGDLNCVPDKGLLPRRVFHVEQGNVMLPTPSRADGDRTSLVYPGNRNPTLFGAALLPTPNANGNGNTPANHMRKKAERCGGPRFSITDLEVLARNEFRQVSGILWPTPHGMCVPNERYAGPSGNELGHAVNHEEKRLWPTTTTDAKATRNETAGRTNPDSKHHSGTTLLDALIKNGDVTSRVEGTLDASDEIVSPFAAGIARALSGSGSGRSGPQGCWPTPTARLGESRGAQAKRFENPDRSNDLDDAVAARGVKGSLNPTWVSWLMGVPLWWTDPDWPTEFTTFVPWTEEPLHVAPRVATGVKKRSDQLRALGNAVVWPCAWYALGRALAATPEVGAEEVLAEAT